MANMFNIQLPMIQSLPGFAMMANCGPSFRDALEPLMVAIYTSPHLLLSKVSIGIEKDFFHKTAFSYAISTCSSSTSLQAGRVLQQMLESGLMHWQKGFQCLKDSFILQMQDILIARNFLFLFGVFGIIFRSGVLQVFGMCLIQGLYYFLNNPTAQQMQRNYSIFVILRHAMLLNVFLVFSSNASGFSFFLLTKLYSIEKEYGPESTRIKTIRPAVMTRKKKTSN